MTAQEQISTKNVTKEYTAWEEVFASAKPMKFITFNTGRITAKVRTYSDVRFRC